MAQSNFFRIESPADLQARLSQDLQRVSVLYFRADWAEPCKTMDGVTAELAKRWESVLFLSASPLSCRSGSTADARIDTDRG